MQDICKIHIDDTLKDISETVLIDLPEDCASSVKDLIDHNEVYTVMSISSAKLKHEETLTVLLILTIIILFIYYFFVWIENVNCVTDWLIIPYTVCFLLRISLRSGQKLWTTNVIKLSKQWRSLVMCSASFMNQKAPRRLLRNQFQVLSCLSFKSS